jgi:hypothetical protein
MAWIRLYARRLGCHRLVFPRRTREAGVYPVEELPGSAIPDHRGLGTRLTDDGEQRSDHQSDGQQVEEEPP